MCKINHAAMCRVYAEELSCRAGFPLDEDAVSKCLRAAADEIDLLNKSEKTWCEDSTDTVVRDAARKVWLTEAEREALEGAVALYAANKMTNSAALLHALASRLGGDS